MLLTASRSSAPHRSAPLAPSSDTAPTGDLLALRRLIDNELARRAATDPLLRSVLTRPMPAASISRAVAAVQAILRHRQARLADQMAGRELSVEITAGDVTSYFGAAPICIGRDIGEALRAIDERLSVVLPRAPRTAEPVEG